MKIVHICLAGSYNDNWGYQDNIIPKYHKLDGHDVTVITSTLINSKKHSGYEKVDQGEYYLDNGVKVIRIPFIKSPLNKIVEKLRLYRGLYNKLEQEKPDFIFIHGLQFLDIHNAARYIRNNERIKVVVDNHADFANSAKNWLSKNLVHRFIWKSCAKLIMPYTDKFYGVLPARVDFLIEMYDIPENQVELLVLGADDEKVKEARKKDVQDIIRSEHGIKSTDFLIITGGKIDLGKKQIINLMKAVQKINRDDVKLIVFGSVVKELKKPVNSLVDGKRIQYIGWVESDETYKYFGAANLAVFPAGHSVFWEQVVGQGIPILVKYWPGTTHIDLNGNCEFLYKNTVDEIQEKIEYIFENPTVYEKMKRISEKEGLKKFSYLNISRQSLGKNQ